MNKRRVSRPVLLMCLFLVFIVLPGVCMWRFWRQNELDQNLTEEIGHCNAPGVHLLLQRGACPNADMWHGYSWHDHILKSEDALPYPVLIYAIDRDDVASVQWLLEAGADVQTRDASGCTPLAQARKRGDTELIHLLQQAGATE